MFNPLRTVNLLCFVIFISYVNPQTDDPLRPWPKNFQYYPYDNNVIINEASYFVVASKIIRPGQIYRLAVNLLESKRPLTIRSAIQRDSVEIASASERIKPGSLESLIMRIPRTTVDGEFKLRVEGLYDNIFGGVAFKNESILRFSQRSMTIFIQTDQPVYIQGQLIRFRAIPINTELKPYDDIVDVYMLDPNRFIMRRWLSRQSNLGTVSLSYQLSDQPKFGQWTIQIVAQNQIEEYSFTVEEYYQTRFEVNVTMPSFFFTKDTYITGTIMANYTSGGPVKGNLTVKATIVPIPDYRYQEVGARDFDKYVVEKYLNFEEELPFWFPVYSDYYNYYDTIPHLKYFNGVYNFKYPISELEQFVPNMDGVEITITATVGDRFLEEIISGYSKARVFNSNVKIQFLGDSPQVFKPAMVFTSYIAASYHDGSPLPDSELSISELVVESEVAFRTRGRNNFKENPIMSSLYPGIWEVKSDLRAQLGLEDDGNVYEVLNDIESMKMRAVFRDSKGQESYAHLLLLSHFSPNNRHIKVRTSTKDARVGEYIIFHVQSNFFLDSFNYILMSKGIILYASSQHMTPTITTFAVALSSDMAPTATIVVYKVGKYGDVVADSLTFPVNGISRNNFTVFVNNRKARTGKKVEIAVYGEPGAYIGLSGVDISFFSMQSGNEVTYSEILTKMSTYDEDTNGTHVHTWYSHFGDPDVLVHFPSSTYGIDANRTFEYSGLIVFSDVEVPRRLGTCNETQGFSECLNGKCYRSEKKCDGKMDCDDGTDESRCNYNNHTEIREFRKYRFSKTQRHYDSVWIWKDINIGPHGRYIFDIDVPSRPTHWVVSAFGMSPKFGFGLLQKPIEYMGILPFFINVEMPEVSVKGEQVGIRVTVFNYMTKNIEAVVALMASKDYKFVHVEKDGIVSAYNARTSFKEHQFFIYLKAQEATVVYLPIVPVVLGNIVVTVYASTLIGKDKVSRNLLVVSEGLPQYRHQSILLDLSNRAYIFQYMHVNVTDTPLIPYNEDRYYIFDSNKAFVTVVGDVVGPIFPTMPVNATSLLTLPMDCAEQTAFSFAANMYTTLYMRFINRDRKTEKTSFYHMNIFYQKLLSFMNGDGSFSYFRSDWNSSSPSVWLTAYCTRILQEASFYEWENYIFIDPMVIAKSVSWVLRHQTEYGSFYEVSWAADRKSNSSLGWENDRIEFRNITLTAHVVIMLNTVKDLAGGLATGVSVAQGLAIHWLEKNLDLIERRGEAYDIALVAYALMLSNTEKAETAFGLLIKHARSEGGLTYWGKERVPPPPFKMENQKPFSLARLPYKYDASNIEATSYALLVYVARQEVATETIVKWLNSQRLTDGGWASTQDTAWAMKALIEYTNRNRLRDVSNLTINIEATSLPGKTKVLHVTSQNIAQLQRIEIPYAWGTVKVQAKGAGYAILQMTVQYNVDIPRFQTPPPIKAFDLETRANYHGRNKSHITYNSCTKWTNVEESVRSGMAILDVAIPTGYIIQQQNLDAYVLSKTVRNLQRARFLDRKVVFYFDYIDETETCINFTIERWYPVANFSRYLPIKVYDYYAPERFNETIFDSSAYTLNICEVCGSSQCPYCPIYNAAVKYLPVLVNILVISAISVWFPHRYHMFLIL